MDIGQSLSNHYDAENQHLQEAQTNFRVFYTLPRLRYSVLLRCLVFVGAVTVITLWITGGDSDYLIHSVTHFTFLQSVFDLAVMAFLKTVLFFVIYHLMEKYTLRQIEDPYDVELQKKKLSTHLAAILISLALLTYATVKGGLVLYRILNDKDYVDMHVNYFAALGCAFGFNLCEFLISLGSFKAMRRLKIIRILHRMNDSGLYVDEEGKPITKPATLKRVIGLAKPEAGLLTGGILCMFVSSGSQMLSPLFFGRVIDAAQKSMEELNTTVLILLAINVGGAIGAMFRSWLFTVSGQRLVARLRSNLFTSIIRQEVAFFDITRTGELTNRLASDTQVIQNAVTVNISMLARNFLQITGSLVVMFVINASLTGVLLSVVPIISIAAVIYGRYLQRMQKTFQDRLADASTTAEEVISSIRTVRTFTSETKASNTYWSDIDKSYQIGKKLAFLVGIFEGMIGTVSGGAIALVLWYGGKLVNEHIISAGVVTSFVLYTLQVAIAFGTMTALYGDFMKAVGASARIFELMDRHPEIPLEGGLSQTKLTGSIEFKNVHFTYPSRPDTEILKGVSFRVEPGQMVALVGPSGGGKSTMVNLIERFYDPDQGSILLGDWKIPDLDPGWFRTKISMVSQEPTLFACSIKDNILYGKDATMEQVISAAKQANAHDFISTFDEGYDTLVGERGVRLSGGQKQRVAIARALIMDPTILLLDEATSALDAESEHLVQEAIDRAMVNRTVIVIAHRLSTVRNANQVIVIDKGVIGEQGTHEELLANNGTYKKLILRQLTAGHVDVSNGNGDTKNNADSAASNSSGEDSMEVTSKNVNVMTKTNNAKENNEHKNEDDVDMIDLKQ